MPLTGQSETEVYLVYSSGDWEVQSMVPSGDDLCTGRPVAEGQVSTC